MIQNMNKNPVRKTTLNVTRCNLRKTINLNKDIFYDADDICNIDLDMPISPKTPKLTSIFSNQPPSSFTVGR
jgi:hypothetical protein